MIVLIPPSLSFAYFPRSIQGQASEIISSSFLPVCYTVTLFKRHVCVQELKAHFQFITFLFMLHLNCSWLSVELVWTNPRCHQMTWVWFGGSDPDEGLFSGYFRQTSSTRLVDGRGSSISAVSLRFIEFFWLHDVLNFHGLRLSYSAKAKRKRVAWVSRISKRSLVNN